jgi:hypothetical protein
MRKAAPALLWMAFIFATSCTVIRRSTFVASVQHNAPTTAFERGFPDFWDHSWVLFVKGWHFTEYAVLAILLSGFIDKRWLAVLIAVAFAASDEYHQTFVADRGGNIVDVTIDAAGALAGIVLLSAWTHFRSSRELVLD